MSELSLFCRFCANEKPQQSLINLKKTDRLQDTVKQKMSIFNEDIVDFTNENLPESICISCHSTLDSCYEFFVQAKESQVVLSMICDHRPDEVEKLNVEPVKEEFDGLELDSWVDPDPEPDIADGTWSSYPWRCTRCEIFLSSMQELRLHIQKCHGICCVFQCEDCDVKTTGFQNFVEHVRMHRSSLRNYCEYCNIKIETPAHVNTHMHNCISCGQTFSLQKQLLAHIEKYRPKLSEQLEPFNDNLESEKYNSVKCNRNDTKLIISTSSDTKLSYHRAKSGCQKKRTNTLHKINDLSINIRPCDTTPEKTIKSSNHKLKNHKKKIQDLGSLTLIETKAIKEESINLSKDIEAWSDYPCICKFCTLTVDNWGILKLHCISHHQRCFGMKCIDCEDDDSHSWDLFAQHVVTHRPNLINSCHYCHAPITDDDQLYHYQTHKAHFQCIACGQQFKNMRDFRCHDNKLDPPLLKPPRKRRRSPIRDEEVICNICSFRAKTPWFLEKHKLTHSERKRDFLCDRCGKAFMSKVTLDDHSKLHKLREDEPKEICKVCGRACFTINRLRDHVKSHNLVMPFQCNDCKKFFRSKSSLRSHVIVHMGIKPFACQYCPKRFNRKTLMQTHEYQHTGARPFSCDICCIHFSSWSNCDKHLRRIHGTSLAKRIVTPYGKMEIDPSTGKPRELSITSDLKEWTKSIIEAKKGRKKKTTGESLEGHQYSEM